MKGIKTTATFDPKTREFILNTPTEDAMKFWIGGLSQTATVALVWAQLIVGDKSHGPHCFYTRVRNEKFETCPGVTIGDCGQKVGNNGIDNGFAIFENYRIPYNALLNKVANINESGEYESPIKSDA